jgi:two-component system sensor histidine kinase ChiS
MAIFPRSSKDAIEASQSILAALGRVNLKRAGHGQESVRVGMGIHRGKVILGTIGYQEQMQNTAISDAVNVAARLESATKNYGAQILISREALEASGISSSVKAKNLGHIELPGHLPIEVFEIVSEPKDVRFKLHR